MRSLIRSGRSEISCTLSVIMTFIAPADFSNTGVLLGIEIFPSELLRVSPFQRTATSHEP